mmetsp:Transcript_35171/g.95359  ORF Transcript_35171/g.95359 Transcript_35171/m.95359 type:complete len:205 (-) Transcript_35171:3-617(-)
MSSAVVRGGLELRRGDLDPLDGLDASVEGRQTEADLIVLPLGAGNRPVPVVATAVRPFDPVIHLLASVGSVGVDRPLPVAVEDTLEELAALLAEPRQPLSVAHVVVVPSHLLQRPVAPRAADADKVVGRKPDRGSAPGPSGSHAPRLSFGGVVARREPDPIHGLGAAVGREKDPHLVAHSPQGPVQGVPADDPLQVVAVGVGTA